MLYNKTINLLNYNERNLFSVNLDGTFNRNPSEEFLIFEGRKIYLKAKPKTRNFRIVITVPKKNTHSNVLSSTNIPTSPKIQLSHPIKAKENDILDFCQRSKEWIIKICTKYEKELAKTNQIVQSHNGEVLLFGEWIQPQTLSNIAKDIITQEGAELITELESKKLESKWLKSKALNSTKTTKQMLSFVFSVYITRQVSIIARQMGLRYSKVSIRESFSRFGSCTGNRLSFSLLLVCAKPEEIDYVIIHELCHIVHKDHSPRFWNLVGQFCPNWKELRDSLRKDYSLFCEVLRTIN